MKDIQTILGITTEKNENKQNEKGPAGADPTLITNVRLVNDISLLSPSHFVNPKNQAFFAGDPCVK